MLSWLDNMISRNSSFVDRPYAEVLLRMIVYEMYKNDYIDTKKSIIDIGSWIGDNSTVWAKWLIDDAVVFAVDPSPENQSYSKVVAKLNNIKNIKWIEAVCNEISGKKLDFEGNLDHAKFKEANSSRYLISTTLDQIVEDEKDVVIGLPGYTIFLCVVSSPFRILALLAIVHHLQENKHQHLYNLNLPKMAFFYTHPNLQRRLIFLCKFF